jgi:hypothetical protein
LKMSSIHFSISSSLLLIHLYFSFFSFFTKAERTRSKRKIFVHSDYASAPSLLEQPSPLHVGMDRSTIYLRMQMRLVLWLRQHSNQGCQISKTIRCWVCFPIALVTS